MLGRPGVLPLRLSTGGGSRGSLRSHLDHRRRPPRSLVEVRGAPATSLETCDQSADEEELEDAVDVLVEPDDDSPDELEAVAAAGVGDDEPERLSVR
jgi:hypothetical protein